MTKGQTSVITDWRTSEDDLPDVLPGEEYVCVITPQKHVVLCRISIRDLTLVHLQIGVLEFPFELERGLDAAWIYRPLIPRQLQRRNGQIGIVPGMDVRVTLRNETRTPAKPRVELLVQEETI